jgi:hypothetical protein
LSAFDDPEISLNYRDAETLTFFAKQATFIASHATISGKGRAGEFAEPPIENSNLSSASVGGASSASPKPEKSGRRGTPPSESANG